MDPDEVKVYRLFPWLAPRLTSLTLSALLQSITCTSNTMPLSLDQLPVLVLDHIFSQTDPGARIVCLLVSKSLQALARPVIPYRFRLAPRNDSDAVDCVRVRHPAHEPPCWPNLRPDTQNELCYKDLLTDQDSEALLEVAQRFTPRAPLERIEVEVDNRPPGTALFTGTVLENRCASVRSLQLSLQLSRTFQTMYSQKLPLPDSAALPSLTSLMLRRGTLNVRDITAFSGLTHIELFDIKVEHWEQLLQFPALVSLSLLNIYGEEDWASVQHLTGLTRLSVRRPAKLLQLLEAVPKLTNLINLSIEAGMGNAVDRTARHTAVKSAFHNPGKLEQLRLVFTDKPRFALPESLSAIRRLHVLSRVVLPLALPSLTHIVINGSPMIFGWESFFRPLRPLFSAPSATHVHVPYDQLGSVLGCPLLRHLMCTHPHINFLAERQVELLAAVRAGAWRHLKTLTLVPECGHDHEPSPCWHTFPSKAEHTLRYTELLEALADTGCTATHVTLYPSSTGDLGAMDALCRFPELSSVTLVKMDVTPDQLCALLKRATMRTVELIDTGLDRNASNKALVEAGKARTAHVLHREMDQLLPSMNTVLDME